MHKLQPVDFIYIYIVQQTDMWTGLIIGSVLLNALAKILKNLIKLPK